jgi:hypothetical protein
MMRRPGAVEAAASASLAPSPPAARRRTEVLLSSASSANYGSVPGAGSSGGPMREVVFRSLSTA